MTRVCVCVCFRFGSSKVDPNKDVLQRGGDAVVPTT